MLRHMSVALCVLLFSTSWESVQAQDYRLGFQGKDLPGQGVLVQSVDAGSPAANLVEVETGNPISLSAGDVVTAVDGKSIQSLDDYFREMRSATPGKVRITVIDSRNSQSIELATPGAMAGPPAAQRKPAVRPAGPATLYVLLIMDTNAANGAGPAIKKGMERLQPLFKPNVPAARLRVITLQAEEVSRRNVLQQISALRDQGLVADRDVLAVYYHGHGAYSLKDSDHIWTTSNGALRVHGDVERAIRQVRPRTTVILSDTCSVLRREWPSAGAAPSETAEKVSPLFSSLFFESGPGFIQITSAMKGQTSSYSDNGGYFTQILCGIFVRNSEERRTWGEVVHEVNAQMKGIDGTHQVAYIVGSGAGADPAPRFGVVAQRTRFSSRWNGVEVTRVLNGYPAQAMHRAADDTDYFLIPRRHVIIEINNEPVHDYAEFVNAVRNSQSSMDVLVHDSVAGHTRLYEVKLRD
jgi:hypothetical protein